MLFEIAVCINKKRLFEHFYKGKHRIYRNSKNLRKERQKTLQMNAKNKAKSDKKIDKPETGSADIWHLPGDSNPCYRRERAMS